MERMLMKPNPIGSEKCGKADCVPCMIGGKGCHVSSNYSTEVSQNDSAIPVSGIQ